MSKLLEKLSTVIDPELRRPITELEMVESAEIIGEIAKVRVLLTISTCPMQDRLRADIERAISEVPEVKDIDLAFGVMNEAQRNRVKEIVRGGKDPEIQFAKPDSLTRVIGVSSGKGGVGKSSLTVNLALAVAAKRLRVGILDGDVYGHSIPRLLGLIGQRPTAIDQLFIPLEGYGIKTVSMEMFKPDRADAVAYRGPLLHRVLQQLLTDAYWGDLDFLFIDLPPGTGDLAISLAQLIPNSEILVVTTPQIAAAEIAERTGRIAYQMKQPVIGVIENMSEFPCPKCGEAISLFGTGGGEETANRLSKLIGEPIPLLGKIPFDPKLREGGDNSEPIVISNPESESSKAIFAVAEKITARKKSLLGVRLGLST